MAIALSEARNVAALVREQARLRPASPALIRPERVITHGQMMVAVGVVARHLRQQGVTPGQVVGLSMGQNPLHVITLLALAQVGAVSLPLHMAVPAERRLLAARRFGAGCVVSGRAEMALDGIPFVSLAGLPFDGSTLAPDAAMHAVATDTPFRIAISSGTSGDPKGMVLTHGAMALRIAQADHGVSALSRTLPMDLNFIVGFRPALSALAQGGALVMPASFSAEPLLQAIVSHAVTHIYLSPAQARSLVEPLATEGVRCPSLLCLRIGGGPLPSEVLREVRRKLSPNVYVSYGSTESGLVTYATPEILERQPGCVGRVCSWARIEVVSADDREQPLPAGSIGVLRIRSEHQVAGYYRDEARSQRHFRDGWFYPGDLGGFDEEGLLYIEGRADDQLNVGGLKVNPEDVEAVLQSHPDVIDAGAFVFSGAEGHEELAAAVVLRAPDRLDAVRAHARDRLGPLAPSHYFAVPSLPRTLTGKLQRGELAAQFSRPVAEH